jgi:glutathione peroxidase
MLHHLLLGLAVVAGGLGFAWQGIASEQAASDVPAVLRFKMTGLDGKQVDLAQFKGKVVLFVNVASECGYTPQYKPLQETYAKYAKEGLVIIGVPCNQFGGQEPGTSKEISEFCQQNYGVTFPMLAKVDVNGQNACDLYKFLTDKATDAKFASKINWNFEKFLIGRNGEIVARFSSDVEPESEPFQKAVRDQLSKK